MHLHILWKDKTKVCQKGYIMLHLEKVNGKNIWDILKLQVSETQKSFVAANDISIIEAYITITANGYAFPFGIYDNETPVGFFPHALFRDVMRPRRCT